MLEQILEAAARSFALGGAVWLSLRVLRVHHPQARMMAWTVVLAVSLAMPVLMHWTTVTIPSRPAPPTAVIDQAYPVAVPRRSPEPKELSPGRTDPLPSSERLDVDGTRMPLATARASRQSIGGHSRPASTWWWLRACC
jgi:hypothetical protein